MHQRPGCFDLRPSEVLSSWPAGSWSSGNEPPRSASPRSRLRDGRLNPRDKISNLRRPGAVTRRSADIAHADQIDQLLLTQHLGIRVHVVDVELNLSHQLVAQRMGASPRRAVELPDLPQPAATEIDETIQPCKRSTARRTTGC